MQGISIFLLSVFAAMVYGIVHDHITVRICLEYFTMGHPPVWGGTQNPEVLAFTWGVIATCWAGAIVGIPLALAARVGKMPKLAARQMVRPIGILLVCMALLATLSGTIAYLVYRHSTGNLFGSTSGIPAPKQVAFMVDLWTHLASYAGGFFGGILLIAWTLLHRWRMDVANQLSLRRANQKSAD